MKITLEFNDMTSYIKYLNELEKYLGKELKIKNKGDISDIEIKNKVEPKVKKRDKNNLDVTKVTKKTFMDEMRKYCVNEDLLIDLYNTLKKHNTLELYLNEHRNQRDRIDFGSKGLMSYLSADEERSGIEWDVTTQGYSFWSNIFFGK